MGRGKRRIHVGLSVPSHVQEALRRIHVIAHDNALAGSRLQEWLDGKHGPVLFAPSVNDDPATGAFSATLELTKPFAEFLAAFGAATEPPWQIMK